MDMEKGLITYMIPPIKKQIMPHTAILSKHTPS